MFPLEKHWTEQRFIGMTEAEVLSHAEGRGPAEEAPVAEEKPAEETPADEPVCFSRNSNHLLYLTYCVPWLWPEYSFPLHQL